MWLVASWGRVKLQGGEIPSRQSHRFPARGSGGRTRSTAGEQRKGPWPAPGAGGQMEPRRGQGRGVRG